MVVTVYSVTLTCTHAVVVLRVYTVQTGILLIVTIDCHSGTNMVIEVNQIFMRFVWLRQWTCVAGTILMLIILCHLVYIAVILQSMTTVTSVLEIQFMLDCMSVEVRNYNIMYYYYVCIIYYKLVVAIDYALKIHTIIIIYKKGMYNNTVVY